ncbi:hypothetical protein BDW42DRAFT_162814 [Aspergillus taichungensis]|uniref:Uncharacterized protein n=1 Tax=Aspergillus taichungensis TaxID=482145 RepID=A0A2J5I360_9EURO|nr:hypothetical protein BDW42DRAFT_162814 [Aspergillus taichungensis]
MSNHSSSPLALFLYLVPLFPSHIFHHLAFFFSIPLFMSAFAGLRSTIGGRRAYFRPSCLRV